VNPAQFTTTTEVIDPIFIFIFGACLVLLIGITAAMVYFVVRYHRSRAPEPTSTVDGNHLLEIIWIVLPTILVMAMFYYGWAGFLALRNVPKGALDITATARMWSWNFSYTNGKTSPKMYVPAGKPVRVELVSVDVIHGFFVPAFRIKRDVVPGMSNYVWFVAPKTGSYDIYCSVYCGTSHSAMISTVEALPEAEFEAWLKDVPAAGKGVDAKALMEQHGCLGCHSLDGSPGAGPSFKGIWGRSTLVAEGGKDKTVTADEAYLKRAILDPQADVVKGFQPIMPSFKDTLKDEEVRAMIEYLKGVK
jgi:cytochrome c oxidase subunit 2